jgi:hypothetical protein
VRVAEISHNSGKGMCGPNGSLAALCLVLDDD